MTPRTSRIALIPGDGIGPEVTREAVKALGAAAAAVGGDLAFTEFDWNADRYLRYGSTLPAGAPEMFRRDFDAILFGALGDPRIPGNQHAADILLGLRVKLDLYANVRPAELLDARLTPLRDRGERDIRFTVIRENTEGLYCGIGSVTHKGMPNEVAIQHDLNTRKGVERIIRYAFEFARAHKLTRLTMSDKSNVLNFGHELWQRVFKEVRDDYPEIAPNHLYIDTLAMEMIRDPSQFQVIVTCNLFGDIASDIAAQIAGGIGLAPSGNIHPGQVSLFEPVHGSAPQIAGKNIANPIGSVLAAAMMLEFLGWDSAAAALRAAVKGSIREGKTTQDLGGPLGTREAGDWLANHVAKHARADVSGAA
jgi:3-isopropylmalate dehydrogenase